MPPEKITLAVLFLLLMAFITVFGVIAEYRNYRRAKDRRKRLKDLNWWEYL